MVFVSVPAESVS